jgi:hypothetical protein
MGTSSFSGSERGDTWEKPQGVYRHPWDTGGVSLLMKPREGRFCEAGSPHSSQIQVHDRGWGSVQRPQGQASLMNSSGFRALRVSDPAGTLGPL